MDIEALKEQLKSWIKSAENNAEEAIQEYDDQARSDEILAKASAYQEVLDFIEQDEMHEIKNSFTGKEDYWKEYKTPQ